MKKNLYRSAFAASLVLAGWLAAPAAQASHIEGTDLTYVQVAPNTYLVTLKLYRDCAGIPAPTNAMIDVTAVGCSTAVTHVTLPMIGTGVEVSDVAPGQATSCSTPPNNSVPGVEQYTYSGLVFLTAAPCVSEWTFIWGDCCRNAAIVNLSQPGSQSFRTRASVQTDSTITNSSPIYSANPVPYVCLNDTMTYMAQATDPDGDSLVFSLIQPIDDAGVAVPFAAGYTYLSPFGITNPMTLDPTTGFMRVRPTQLGDFVVAVQVDEYRSINGLTVKVGTSQRDVQYHVVNCTTPPPAAGNTLTYTTNGATMSVPGVTTLQVRVGNSLSVDIPTSTPATANVNLQMTSNCANEIPGSTFSYTSLSARQGVGHFTWTPTAQDIRSTAYAFSYHVTDNAMPYPNERYGLVRVVVLPAAITGVAENNTADLRIPNVISASGQYARTFAVPGTDAGTYALTIYDRLGRTVYQTSSYDNRWNGSQAAAGLYVYRLQHLKTGEVLRGQLNLLK